MIGGLESIETDFIEQIQRTRGRHTSRYAASFKRHFHVLLNGEPWKQGKTLKDDCRMWIHAAKRLATVKHAALTRCGRSEEHTSELQSRLHLVCRLLLEKKKKTEHIHTFWRCALMTGR